MKIPSNLPLKQHQGNTSIRRNWTWDMTPVYGRGTDYDLIIADSQQDMGVGIVAARIVDSKVSAYSQIYKVFLNEIPEKGDLAFS